MKKIKIKNIDLTTLTSLAKYSLSGGSRDLCRHGVCRTVPPWFWPAVAAVRYWIFSRTVPTRRLGLRLSIHGWSMYSSKNLIAKKSRDSLLLEVRKKAKICRSPISSSFGTFMFALYMVGSLVYLYIFYTRADGGGAGRCHGPPGSKFYHF